MLAPGGGRRIFWLSLYAIAMGLLEAAVVVYLRELYYPDGFRFPLVQMPGRLATVEIVREATTIFMLLAVAALAGRDLGDRFFVFGFLFGTWDLIYYAGLFLFLRWPHSLATWDVLFLIPVPWVSPVLYPVLVSIVLVAGFLAHEVVRGRGREIRPGALEWAVAAVGATAIVVSFWGRSRVAFEGGEPRDFPALLFALGFGAAVLPLARAGLRALRA